MAVVTLDAGHGGYDNGASYQGRREKDDNLNLALAVGNILQNRGVDVRYTRTEDVYQTPQRKAAIANENGSDLFVSFHRNSSPSPNQYSGVQTLVYADSGPRRLLAQNINNELEKVGFTNLGISVRKDLPVIRESDMPAGLVEVGLIRNGTMRFWMQSFRRWRRRLRTGSFRRCRKREKTCGLPKRQGAIRLRPECLPTKIMQRIWPLFYRRMALNPL